jgi:hypothetical protein
MDAFEKCYLFVLVSGILFHELDVYLSKQHFGCLALLVMHSSDKGLCLTLASCQRVEEENMFGRLFCGYDVLLICN